MRTQFYDKNLFQCLPVIFFPIAPAARMAPTWLHQLLKNKLPKPKVQQNL